MFCSQLIDKTTNILVRNTDLGFSVPGQEKTVLIHPNFWQQVHKSSAGFICLRFCAYMVKTKLRSTGQRQEQYKSVAGDFSGLSEEFKKRKIGMYM